MTPHRTAFAAAALLTGLAVSATPARASGDAEYTAESFTGGWIEPPAPPATGQDPAVRIGGGQDDATAEIDLPFEFPFFGRLHTKVTACTNGWLAFGTTTSSESNNPSLPSAAAPNGIVAALWDDLATGSGRVKSFTTGTAPQRVFVVAWHKVDTFSSATAAELSFEVKLFEGTGVIEIAYAPAGTWTGLSYTAGIEDPSGTLAFGAGSAGNTNSGQPSLDWRFTPRAVRVTGALLRDRPVASEGGLGITTETGLAVAGIDVELVRTDTGGPAGRGRSAADGTYTATVLGASPSDVFDLDLLASGEECRVVDGAGAVHRFRIASGIGAAADSAAGTFTLDAGADATNAAIRKAVNVQQAAHRGFAWARDAALFASSAAPVVPAETFTSLDFRLVAGAAATNGRTAYADPIPPAPAVVHVHDAADNPDPWDDDVILREAAHHVLLTISSDVALVGTRSWATATSAESAWADGFGHWFACAVQGRATFIDTKSAATATVFDLEAPAPAPARGPDVTGAVASALWDLVDPANETRDQFEGTLGGAGSSAYDVFRTVDRALDGARAGGYTALQFLDAFTAQGEEDARRAAARAFIHSGAVGDDAREANDLAGEESPLGAVQRVDALTLTRWNEDRFSFDWSPQLTGVLQAAVTQTTTATFEVEVLDPSGVRVAFGTNEGASSKTRVTVTSAGPQDPGTYVLRIASQGDALASYSLAVYEPMRLAEVFPPWTAGQLYKGDVVVRGGVSPYSFTTTADVPGLALASGGSRLTGTPATPGDYDVHLRVTDASGAGTSLETDILLRIHERLSIVPWLGLAEGSAVAVDVGRGGTGAVWETDDVAPAGLDLAEGATLRLTGVAGAARTFTVSGTATDTTGAAFDGQGTVVVGPPLPARGSAEVPSATAFTFWFEAVGGSRADLTFRFTGRGERPVLSAIVDAEGRDVPFAGRVRNGPGRTIRVRSLPVPATGRYFAVFTATTAPAGLRISVGGAVAPPRDVHGIAIVDPKEAVVDLPFEALGGSRLRLEVRPAQVPQAVVPDLWKLFDPSDAEVALPARRRLRGGGALIALTAPAASGTYVLQIVGDGERTGPVFWRVRARSPRSRSFEIL